MFLGQDVVELVFKFEQIICLNKEIKGKYPTFFKNISYVALATFAEALIWFIFNILTGRMLGPDEYGKFTLIHSIGMLLYLPMMFGISTGMVKYSSEKRDFDRQRIIISTSFLLVIIFTFSFIFIYSGLTLILSEILSVPEKIIKLGITFSVFYVFYLITTSTFQGTHQIKKFALIKYIYSAIMLISFFIITSTGDNSYKIPLYSMYVAYLISGIIAIWLIAGHIIPKYDDKWVRTLIKYGSFTFLSAMSYILCTNVDKILINKYLTSEAVGLYNAYNLSSMKIIGMFSGIFITVFFPTISGYEDKSTILKKFGTFVPYILLFGVPLIIIAQVITLKLYGDEYGININLMLIFAITSVLFVLYDIYGWIFNSIGINGVKLTMWGTSTIALVDIFLNMQLIPRFGLEGAIASTAISYLIGLCVIHIMKGKLISI